MAWQGVVLFHPLFRRPPAALLQFDYLARDSLYCGIKIGCDFNRIMQFSKASLKAIKKGLGRQPGSQLELGALARAASPAAPACP